VSSKSRDRKNFLLASYASLLIAVSLLVILSLQAATAESITFTSTGTNGSMSNSSTMSQAIQYDGFIFGYVLDIKGNGVPQSFVTLYKNGILVPADPIFSGNGTDSPMGEYQFSGLGPGNYSIMAEIADAMQFYNGTASYHLDINESKALNVTINGFVFKPRLEPTPAPTAEAQPTAIPTTQPMIAPAHATNNGPNIPGYVYVAVPMTATGIGAFIWVGRRPGKKNVPVKKSTYMEATTYQRAWTTNLGPSTTPRNLPMLNTSPLFRGNPGYRQDVEDLNYESVMNDYTDIAVINRVNRLAKKYSVDQVTIFQDMRSTRYKRY